LSKTTRQITKNEQRFSCFDEFFVVTMREDARCLILAFFKNDESKVSLAHKTGTKWMKTDISIGLPKRSFI
jgi:hypothetical protein